MLDRNSESILHPWEHYLSHTQYYHPVGTVGEAAEGPFSVLAGQLLRSDDERGESRQFHRHGSVGTLHRLW